MTSRRSSRSTSEAALGAQPDLFRTIGRSHIQSLVDELAPDLSGSRVRSIVNGLRSLYRWAQDRELTSHDPAALVRLPAMDARPIERVASPGEFARLLAVLEPGDALPYATGRVRDGTPRPDRALALAGGRPQGRGSRMGRRVGGAQVRGLAQRRAHRPAVAGTAQARLPGAGPPEGRASCARPRTSIGRRLACSTRAGLRRAQEKIWTEAKLRPITLQEARHTAATWLDAAGVAPKIASVLMGHATPERQPGAAQITLARYTHALPEDIERARAKLAAYLADAQDAEAAGQ